MKKSDNYTFFLIIIFLTFILISGCIDSSSNEQPKQSYDDGETDPDYDPHDDDEKDQNNTTNDDNDNNIVNETKPPEEDEEPQDDDELKLENSGIILEIEVDDDDIRAYDRVNFTVIGAPLDSNITWEFPDDTMFGNVVKYFFRSSDYFVVNVTATWDNKFASGSLDVPVKNQDWIDFQIWSTMQKFIRGDSKNSCGVVVNNGITIPEVTITLELTNLTGRVEFGIGVIKSYGKFNFEDMIILDTQTTEGVNATQTFQWYVSDNDMLQFEDIRPYSPSCFLDWVGVGGYVEYRITWLILF